MKRHPVVDIQLTTQLCVFVGGYSESPYLQSVLRSECEKLELRARFPHEPQSAIVRGAVLRGLGGVQPDARCCRRHYGFAVAKPFREGTDPEYLGFTHDYHGNKYCRGRMSWVIEKGDTINQFTTIENDLEWCYHEGKSMQATYMLYGCSMDSACKYVTHNGTLPSAGKIVSTADLRKGVEQVGKIAVDFSGVNLPGFSVRTVDGLRVWSIKFSLGVSLGHEEGLLRVRALINGRELANADFKFDDIEAGLMDTTPTLTAPGAPSRATPTASRAMPRVSTKPKAGVRKSPASRTSVGRKRAAFSVFTNESSVSSSPCPSPRKKRKALQMNHDEISKAEDSE